MSAKRLDKLLNPNENADLANIVQKARDMDHLREAMQRSLPGEDGAGILAANLRENGELVVLAASPAWAAKLRFEEESLIEAARAAGAEVKSCKVRVGRGMPTSS